MASSEQSLVGNYTTVLNIVFLVVTAVLVIRFLRTGGPAMLKMMSTPASEMHHHEMHEHGANHPEMSHHQMHHGEVEPQRRL